MWDAATVARLRRARWREPSRERRWPTVALLVSIVLHGLFVLAVYDHVRASRAPDSAGTDTRDVLQVRFFTDSTPRLVKPPAPLSLPPRTIRPPAKKVLATKGALTLRLPTAAKTPGAMAHIYDKDGLPILPAATASVTTVPDYVQRMPQGNMQIMQHKSSIAYKPTRFDGAWKDPLDPIDSALQTVVDKTKMKKTFNLPKGIRLHCSIGIIPPGGGCRGDPPAAPSAKDGDERLSMAPAQPIAKGIPVPTPPSEAACIAMYRAGKPLAYGCPVDTPIRSVDADMRHRAAATNHDVAVPHQP